MTGPVEIRVDFYPDKFGNAFVEATLGTVYEIGKELINAGVNITEVALQRVIFLGEDPVDVGAADAAGAAALLKIAAASLAIRRVGVKIGRVPGRPSVANIGTNISTQKQARHVFDTPQWRLEKKGYFINQADAQKVLDALHSGDAKIIGTGNNGQLIVRYNGVTGFNNNRGAGFLDQPTNIFIIKGTVRPSVIPTNPNYTP